METETTAETVRSADHDVGDDGDLAGVDAAHARGFRASSTAVTTVQPVVEEEA